MMFLVNQSMVDLNIGTAGLVAILGYLVVFFGLILLMIVVTIMGKIMVAKSKKRAAKPAQAAAVSAPAPAAAASVAAAPGTAGEIKLHDVPEKQAAMVMAIVANKMNKPLNELRFKSIKEVK